LARQYLNNILEQDHRAIKKRIRAKQHLRQFGCARRTIQGYEAMHKIRKGLVRWVKKGDVGVQNQFIAQVFGLAA
jgi:transposase-like protein